MAEKSGQDASLLGARGVKKARLDNSTTYAYAVGHVQNDATACCWFSYLLIYLEKVRRLRSLHAGYVMFSGQIFDALATPLVGILSDATKGVGPCRGRMLWYVLGTIGVFLCFTMTFAMSPFEAYPEVYSVVWFTMGASAFNVAWASVQVAHLAMIPDLSSRQSERVRLVKLRYAFTILANLSVFLLFLHAGGRHGPEKYQFIVVVVLSVGGLFSLWFIRRVSAYLLKHKPYPLHIIPNGEALSDCPAQQSSYSSASALTHPAAIEDDCGPGQRWSSWLALRNFYLIGLTYMGSRIVVNISQVYLQFYILDTLLLDETGLALVPLTLYCSGLAGTCLADSLNQRLGRKAAFAIGGAIVLCACAGFSMLSPAFGNLIYLVSSVLGLGSSCLMITSHSMANDLVGEHPCGGFVYGSFSLMDKLGNGLLILGVQALKQQYCPAIETQQAGPSCANLVRKVLVLLPAISVLLSVITMGAVGQTSDLQRRRSSLGGSEFVEAAESAVPSHGKRESGEDGDCVLPHR